MSSARRRNTFRCVCGGMGGGDDGGEVSVSEVGGVSALIVPAVATLSECFPKWVMCRKTGSKSKATELDGIISVLM